MGPASYFPSIEKKYGKPIEHWMKELKKVSKLAHMEQVAHLKEKFELGHGHANALVAYFRKKQGLQFQTNFGFALISEGAIRFALKAFAFELLG